MKKYVILFLATSSIILGSTLIDSPVFAQDHSANRPGSSTNPIGEQPDTNKIMDGEKSGKIVPEQINRPYDKCADDLNKEELAGAKPPLPKNYKKECAKK